MQYLLLFALLSNMLFSNTIKNNLHLYSHSSINGEIDFSNFTNSFQNDSSNSGALLEGGYYFSKKSSFLLNILISTNNVLTIKKAYYQASFFDNAVKIKIGRDIKNIFFTKFYNILDFSNSNVDNFTFYNKNLYSKSSDGISIFLLNPQNKKQNITLYSFFNNISTNKLQKTTNALKLTDTTDNGSKSIFVSKNTNQPISISLAKKTIINPKITQVSTIKYKNTNKTFLKNIDSVSNIQYKANKKFMIGFEYSTLNYLETDKAKNKNLKMYISGYLEYNNLNNFKALASHILNISDLSSKAILELEYKYKKINLNLRHTAYNGDNGSEFGNIKINHFADNIEFLISSNYKF